MTPDDPNLTLRLAVSDRDRKGAFRLRYNVFVAELGGDGDLVDHDNRFETDAYDPHFDQLVLIDRRRDEEALDHVVGVYRLMPGDRIGGRRRFYSEDEYDLSPLLSGGRRLLELGRSCVHPDYRGGTAMYRLWQGLANYVIENDIEILFGVASFHGTDVTPLRAPLSLLHANHLAPPDLRVRARDQSYQPMDLIDPASIDRLAAMRATPALIKAYLRFGGFVGDGAFIDHAFNTIDVCLVMDTARMNASARSALTQGTR